MIIEKTARNVNSYKRYEFFYNSAREGMFDLLENMSRSGLIKKVFLPGYIGWSPKEGSGIFDPISKLDDVEVDYYKMTSDLCINYDDLLNRISKLNTCKFVVLIVNYFGFIDSNIGQVCNLIRNHSGWIVEDNAHGFFTYHFAEKTFSDATFFSLHKMFPFIKGGSLLINSDKLTGLIYKGSNTVPPDINPWLYDLGKIAEVRKSNYIILDKIIKEMECDKYFVPLRTQDSIKNVVPQTYPIKIITGNRDKIYELMNNSGYGIVSLYHTLIESLRSKEYQESYDLSRCILNLPVHQDVDNERYSDMIKFLIKCCIQTSI